MANAPESCDSNFTWEHFAGVMNKDLADVLGNFVNRVTKFCVARFDGQVPGEGEYGEDEQALIAELDKPHRRLYRVHRECRIPQGAGRAARHLGGGQRISDPRRALDPYQDRPRKAAVGVRMGLNLVHLFAHLAWPVMPDFARTIHECIQPVGYRGGVDPVARRADGAGLDELEAGQPIKAPEILIAKITDEQIAEWKARFGGASA